MNLIFQKALDRLIKIGVDIEAYIIFVVFVYAHEVAQTYYYFHSKALLIIQSYYGRS